MTQRLCKFILATFLIGFTATHSFGAEQNLNLASGVISNDTNRLKVLLDVSNLVPTIFTQSVSYDVPLFDVLENAEKASLLNPAILGRINSPQTILSIETKLLAAITMNQTSIDPAGLKLLKKALQSNLPASRDKAIEEILHLMKQPLLLRTEGLFTGLIQLFSQEEKVKLFRFSQTQKLSYLSTHLTESLLTQFDFKRYGLTTQAPSTLLTALKSAINAETRLIQLLSATLVSHGQDFRSLNQLGENELDLFVERQAHDHLIAEIFKSINLPKNFSQWMGQNLSRYVSTFTSQKTETVTQDAGKLILEEMPALFALFRGFLAGDCSSSYSALYALSPNERMFAIKDQQGETKGALSGTYTEINGERAFYIHTINGPRLSSADIDILMRTMYHLKTQLGVKHIVTPQSKQVSALINYAPIKAVFEDLAIRGKKVNQSYIDVKIRTVIGKFHSAAYDSPESNDVVHIYQPGEKYAENLAFKTQSRTFNYNLAAPLDRTKLFFMILEQKLVGRGKTAMRINALLDSTTKIDEVAAATYLELFENPRRLELNEFISDLIQAGRSIGLTISEKYIWENPVFFGMGLLRSRDAFTDIKQQNKIVEIALALQKVKSLTGSRTFDTGKTRIETIEGKEVHVAIRKEFDSPTQLGEIFQEHVAELSKNEKFLKYYKSLFSDNLAGIKKVQDFNKLGFRIELAQSELKGLLMRTFALVSVEHDTLSEQERNEIYETSKRIKLLKADQMIDLWPIMVAELGGLSPAFKVYTSFFGLGQLINLKSITIMLAKNKGDALEALNFHLSPGIGPSQTYVEEMLELVANNTAKLNKLGIKAYELEKLDKFAPIVYQAYSELQSLKDKPSLIKIVNSLNTTNKNVKSTVQQFQQRVTDKFMANNPSFAELKEFLKSAQSVTITQSMLPNIRSQANRLSQWTELLKGIDEHNENSGHMQQLWMNELTNRLEDEHLLKNSSLKEFKDLAADSTIIRYPGIHLKILTHAIKLIKVPEDFLSLINKLVLSKPNHFFDFYISSVLTLIDDNLSNLSKIFNREQDLMRLEEGGHFIFATALRVHQARQHFKNPEQFISLFTGRLPKGTKIGSVEFRDSTELNLLNESSLKWVRMILDKNIDVFLRLKPSVDQATFVLLNLSVADTKSETGVGTRLIEYIMTNCQSLNQWLNFFKLASIKSELQWHAGIQFLLNPQQLARLNVRDQNRQAIEKAIRNGSYQDVFWKKSMLAADALRKPSEVIRQCSQSFQ